MARPIRMDYPDTFYHVLSRGNEKREIFHDEKDYLKFLDTLGTMVGQFKSFLIENERYFTAMCLYIHGNPLRAGIVKKLSEYKWSSFKDYVDKKYQVPWLTTELVLGMYGESRRRFLKAQQLYFREAGDLLKDLQHGLYLESKEFSEECIQRAKREMHHEKPQYRLLLRDRNIRALSLEILKGLGEKDPDSILNSRKKHSLNRDLTIYILYHLGVYRNVEIGEVFGVGYTAVSGTVKRAQEHLASDERLRKMVNKISNDF